MFEFAIITITISFVLTPSPPHPHPTGVHLTKWIARAHSALAPPSFRPSPPLQEYLSQADKDGGDGEGEHRDVTLFRARLLLTSAVAHMINGYHKAGQSDAAKRLCATSISERMAALTAAMVCEADGCYAGVV